MTIIVKCFLTYASISMVAGIFYGFVYGTIVGINHISIGLFLILWGGPTALAISVGVPIGLWKMWSAK